MAEDKDTQMKDLFGEESDEEPEQQQPPPPTSQPSPPTPTPPTTSLQPPTSLPASTAPADMAELFGSDSEGEGQPSDEAAEDEAADPSQSPDPYADTRPSRGLSDLEQQLAGFEDDELPDNDSDLPTTDNSRASVPDQQPPSDALSSQQSQRDAALAKRKKAMGEDGNRLNRSSSLVSSADGGDAAAAEEGSSKAPPSSPLPAAVALAHSKAAASTATGAAITLVTPPLPTFPPHLPVHLVRLPNVIDVCATPFAADTYVEQKLAMDEGESEAGQGAFFEKKEKQKAVSRMVENVMRWREVEDAEGRTVRQSNARLVRWSDGSASLFVGKECFDVVQSQADQHRSYIYAKHQSQVEKKSKKKQKSSTKKEEHEDEDEEKMEDEEAEEVDEDDSTAGPSISSFLRSVGSVVGNMQFKVTGIESASHMKLKEVLFEVHTKKAKIERHWEEVDPEKERFNREKEALSKDRLKRSQEKKKASQEHRKGRHYHGNREFFEEDDRGQELTSMKRKYADDEEGEGKLARAKGGYDDEDDEEAEDEEYQVEEDADEEEEEAGEHQDDDAEVEVAATNHGEEKPGGGSTAADAFEEDPVFQRHASTKKRRVLADEESD